MNLKNQLSAIVTGSERQHLVHSFDVVGDIAIVTIPPELSRHRDAIADAVLQSNRRIKVVARRDGPHQGDFRTIRLEIIGGENRLETEHKEFGIRLCLNLGEVYFSVRSSTERRRIAAQVLPGENVLVMFSGIAPYPLHIDRFSKAGMIVGIEKNLAAHRYAEMNRVRNAASGSVALLQGDVTDICPSLGVAFDRIVMPLPTAAISFLPWALACLKDSGHVHVYTMQSRDSIGAAVCAVRAACMNAGRHLSRYRIVVCGHTAPNRFRYCIDCCINPFSPEQCLEKQ